MIGWTAENHVAPAMPKRLKATTIETLPRDLSPQIDVVIDPSSIDWVNADDETVCNGADAWHPPALAEARRRGLIPPVA